MGVSGSSSKRKSSKRKSDKVSSKRKKDKRKESKKRRRDYDSVSSYSDDESFNSDSSSSSDHKRRLKKSKKRLLRDYSASSYSDDYSTSSDSLSSHDNDNKSRKRKRLKISSKSTKRKTRKRFSCPDSNKDAHRVKKRKRSTKDSVKPKKKSLKKKLKKHASSSSSSDDNNTDGKRQRSKNVLNKETETRIGRESCKGNRKNKIRSPRRSSLSISDASVGHSDEALAPINNTLNNSRRLKSVITIVNHSHEEEDRWEKDLNKEEIVCDHDDYPSPRSLDSNEGGNEIESNNNSRGASEERMVVEHFAREEITEAGESETNDGKQNKDAIYQPGGVDMDNIEKEIETEDDLESILRQKALENLRKFRVGPRNIRNLNENEVKGSSSMSADIFQNKSTEHGIPDTQEVNQRSRPTLVSKFSCDMEVKKQTEGEHFDKEPKMAKHVATQSPDGKALVGCSKEESTISKAVLAEAISRSDISLGAEDTNPSKLSIIGSASSDRLISEEHILEKPESETKEGSEFEQKTMSVMRGGEMVQVSYKVYIPKRAPALGRRQLRR